MIHFDDGIGHLTTEGVFSLDGQDFDVENNVWMIGNRSGVTLIDAPHSAEGIAAALDGIPIANIVCTHGHNDHVNAAVALRERSGARVLLHPADLPLWEAVYGSGVGTPMPDGWLVDGMKVPIGSVPEPTTTGSVPEPTTTGSVPEPTTTGSVPEPTEGYDFGTLEVIHTPGHTPGGCCLFDRRRGVLFSGDTLFAGGPGATGRTWSDFPTIIESIRSRLLVLPASTRVLTGHGSSTTIGDEAPSLSEWIARGR